MSKPLPPIPPGKPITGAITKTMDRRFLSSMDLVGHDVVELTIDRVEFLEELKFENGNKEKNKNIIYFKETDKPLVLNVTNSKAICMKLRTNKVNEWSGQKIRLFAEAGRYFGEDQFAVRVKV
jgi:hypothetical protein